MTSRLSFGLLVALGLSTIVRGQTAPPVPPVPSATGDRANLQAYIDAMSVASPLPMRATTALPASLATFRVDGPLFLDRGAQRLRGDGRGAAQGTRIVAAPGYSGPVVTIGIPRAGAPGADRRPDLFGKLDATIAPRADFRRGFTTTGDGYAMSQGSPLTHGPMSKRNRNLPDYWQDCDYLTAEFAVEGPSSGQMPLTFMGSGNGADAPIPFVMSSRGGGTYDLFVGYQSARWSPVSVAHYTFSSGPATGVIRLAIQIDLTKPTVAAWINSNQVDVTGPKIPPNVRFPEPGTAPGDNTHAFFINAQYYPAGLVSGAVFSTYGLSLSKTLKYADLGPGTPQTPNPQWAADLFTIPGAPTGGTFTLRIGDKTTAPISANPSVDDLRAAIEEIVGAGNVAIAVDAGARVWRFTGLNGTALLGSPGACDGSKLTGFTITDAYRYVPGTALHDNSANVDPWNIAQIPFTEPPGSRYVVVTGNQTVGSSVMFLLDRASTDPITSQTEIEGMEIDGGDAYGIGVLMFHCLETRIIDSRIRGGLHGAANLIFGANYKFYSRDCQYDGFDSPFSGYWMTAQLDTTNLLGNGRWGMRLTGCNVDSRHMNVATSGNPQYGFVRICGSGYGGTYTFDDFSVDNEDRSYEYAGFYAERHNYGTTRLRITDGYFANTGCPVIRLRDMAAPPNSYTWPESILIADGIRCDSATPGAVEVDGPGWKGSVNHSSIGGVLSLGTYGPSSMKSTGKLED